MAKTMVCETRKMVSAFENIFCIKDKIFSIADKIV
jgi:hypothetical protein